MHQENTIHRQYMRAMFIEHVRMTRNILTLHRHKGKNDLKLVKKKIIIITSKLVNYCNSNLGVKLTNKVKSWCRSPINGVHKVSEEPCSNRKCFSKDRLSLKRDTLLSLKTFTLFAPYTNLELPSLNCQLFADGSQRTSNLLFTVWVRVLWSKKRRRMLLCVCNAAESSAALCIRTSNFAAIQVLYNRKQSHKTRTRSNRHRRTRINQISLRFV